MWRGCGARLRTVSSPQKKKFLLSGDGLHAVDSGRRECALILMEILGDTSEMNHQDAFGSTSLHKLAKNGDVEFLEAMLATCVNVNTINRKNETALHIAILYHQDNIQIVQLLLRHPKFNFTRHNHAILHSL
jgi:hypothetical protein